MLEIFKQWFSFAFPESVNSCSGGGAGYIGSHTCLQLPQRGDAVTVFDNLVNSSLAVDKSARAAQKQQTPRYIWFTGLSGSGKSTLANLLEPRLHALGRHTYVLDGDRIRCGLNRDLGFAPADRVENIRRVAEVASLMVDAGLIAKALRGELKNFTGLDSPYEPPPNPDVHLLATQHTPEQCVDQLMLALG